MKIYYKYLALLLGLVICFSIKSIGQDGAAIFKQNCAACHKLGKRLVGPDLLGVNEKRNEEWLLKFIRSSNTMIESGDPEAVAIFEEFNKTMMIDQALSDDEIKATLAYIREETAAKEGSKDEGKTETVEFVPVEYTEEDIELGLQLFTGENRFVNGGASCISCHHINNDLLMSGGLLAKDLTNVYGRMGDAGVAGILGAPPFPAMAVAYRSNALDSAEIAQLTAFLKYADSVSKEQDQKSGYGIFILGGGGGLILLFLLIALHWRARLKVSVKDTIYRRQIKSI